MPSALIVDDSLTVRTDLADAFRGAGFEAITCASVAEARAALRQEPVDVCVLDVVLPDGDGVELLTEIRGATATAELPVLMLSTEANVGRRIHGLRSGANEYVGKPYDRRYVVARARELLKERQREGASRAHVLIVDDSPTFRCKLHQTLAAAGYEVSEAGSGEEALKRLAELCPDALIIDGRLPGIDGAAVLRSVRMDAALRSMPCLLLTGSSEREEELRALDAGADGFVRKQADLAEVIARLSSVLRARREPAIYPSLHGPKKLLVVDDSDLYREELAAALLSEGYDVAQAQSGEEAIELLAVQPVDCVLLDVRMPGLGGIETCRRIKAAPGVRDVPLILLTAMEDRGVLVDGLATGADDYVAKSSSFEVLHARVRAQLRRRQQEDESRRARELSLQREREAVESRAQRELAQTRALLVQELERKNRELEAFVYSVSHDLRAPLRSIDGFTQALLEDQAGALDDRGLDYLRRVRRAAQRMGELIDDLLYLSRVGRAELRREPLDLSAMARAVLEELRAKEPEREVRSEVQEGLGAVADARLLRVALENLLGNAWKFTARTPVAHIECGAYAAAEGPVYFVRDNGAGFDMNYAGKMFRPFQRLHRDTEFSGTGIGLATVHRIVERHGGAIWAQAEIGRGASFYFTLPEGSDLGGLS